MSGSLRKEERLKTKLRIKVREWKYLRDSEKDLNSLFSIYENDLNRIISELSEYNVSEPQSSIPLEFDSSGPHNCHDPITEILDLPQIDNPPWAKKLYKQIALKTHPDKVQKLSLNDEEKSKREKIFKEAAGYLQEEKYTDLIEIAQDLNLEISIPNDQYLIIVESSIQEINSYLKSKEVLAPWKWGEVGDDTSEKVNFMFFLWEQLGEPTIPREALEYYFKCGEKNESTALWHQKYTTSKSPAKVKKRTRPGPPIGRTRRGKTNE